MHVQMRYMALGTTSQPTALERSYFIKAWQSSDYESVKVSMYIFFTTEVNYLYKHFLYNLMLTLSFS